MVIRNLKKSHNHYNISSIVSEISFNAILAEILLFKILLEIAYCDYINKIGKKLYEPFSIFLTVT